jgi:hypothetical protein
LPRLGSQCPPTIEGGPLAAMMGCGRGGSSCRPRVAEDIR